MRKQYERKVKLFFSNPVVVNYQDQANININEQLEQESSDMIARMEEEGYEGVDTKITSGSNFVIIIMTGIKKIYSQDSYDNRY